MTYAVTTQTTGPAWEVAWHHATAHGVLTAIRMPDSADPVPSHVLDFLHPKEREFALTLRGYRQTSFVGGRLALRGAVHQLGHQPAAMLPDDRGAPAMPRGLRGSVSHKRTLAVGLVCRDHGYAVGVDIEDYGPPRPGIESKVLRPEELAAIQDLPPPRRWLATVLRFSVKESIYKALDPWVRRYVSFQEASLELGTDGNTSVTLTLANGEGPFEVDARYAWGPGVLLTSARIRPLR
jgi:4'-phosphopantetheinyl transferase EntD